MADETHISRLDPTTASTQTITSLGTTPFCGFYEYLEALGVDRGGTLLGLLHCDQWSYLVTIDRSSGSLELASSNMAITGGLAYPPAFPVAEHCGNCIDDDGDGRVDVEDDDCCDLGTSPLTVSRVRLRPKNGTSAFQLSGRLAAEVLPPANYPTEHVVIQLHDQGSGETVCGTIPATAFRKNVRSGNLTFADPHRTLAGAHGFDHVALRQQSDDVRIALQGRNIPLMPSSGGALLVTLAQHPQNTRASLAQCHSGAFTIP